MAANDEVIAGPFYHGTKAGLRPGDLIAPGYRSNYGDSKRTSPWVYMSATLSPWGAELAQGDGPGRIYIVEPTGPFVDDPDLTDKRFEGNPTKSYRSRDPLAERDPAYFAAKLTYTYERMLGEPVSAHTPEALAEMFRDPGIEGESRIGTGDSYRFVGVRR